VPGWQVSLAASSPGRPFDPPVGAVDQVERNAAVCAQPLLQQVIGSWLVGNEVHRPQRSGMQAARISQRGDRRQVEVIHQDQHGPAGEVRRMGRLVGAEGLDHAGFAAVLPVEPDEQEHHDREHRHDQPGALGELHDREDHHHQRRVYAAGEVNDESAAPGRLLGLAVVSGHAEAGHGEPGEHADRVERDQVVGVGADHEQQGEGQHGQHDDAVGEDQPVAALRQPAGQE